MKESMELNDLKPGYYWFKLGSYEEYAEEMYAGDPWRLGIWDGQDWNVPYDCIDALNPKLIQLVHPIPTPDGKIPDIDANEKSEPSMRDNKPPRTNADMP